MECLNKLINNDFFIAIMAAIFAVFFKHVYDYFQRKNDLNKKKEVLIDIIDNVILINLYRHRISYNDLLIFFNEQKINKSNITHYLTSSLDSNIINFFSQLDLIDIFKKIDVNISDFYEGIHDLESFKKFSPIILETSYIENVNKVIENKVKKYNLSIYDILKNDDYYKEFKIEIEHYYNLFINSIHEQIKNVNQYISNFEKISIELKKKNHS